jgi:hypothetical protein
MIGAGRHRVNKAATDQLRLAATVSIQLAMTPASSYAHVPPWSDLRGVRSSALS